MPYRNKTYVAFDADNDIRSYNLMKAWRANDNIEFNFYNAHDLTTIRSGSGEAAIKASLRERMKNSNVLVLLIGENTRYCHTYVKWEIELAMKHDLPIIATNINGIRGYDSVRTPLVLRDELAIHIPFGPKIMAYALDNWPDRHVELKSQGEESTRCYKDSVYQNLGI